MKIVPDTSVIISQSVTDYLNSHENQNTRFTVIIPECVIGEIEAQANTGAQTADTALTELQQLTERDDDEEDSVTLEHDTKTASQDDINHASTGRIDALIRNIARKHNATLLTHDRTQYDLATASNVTSEYLEPDTSDEDPSITLGIEGLFTEDTLSLHLKADAKPKAKRGSITDLALQEIAATPTPVEQMRAWATEIERAPETDPHSYYELSQNGMSIIQHHDYRIAVAQPPFSEGIEITAVRPITKTTLDDYTHQDELRDRFREQKRGVLISGAPGAGKSTFAQAAAEFLNDEDYTVKTMENPRDLQVGPDITQYTALNGDMANTADSLLLVRPDYTVYDEVRKTHDFEVFSDMRLAGVGMIGVVHATRAIDALQRLVGRVELGMIPQIVDTVAYIEAGDIHTLYDIETVVKIPDGMDSEDLARPVIQVTNHETESIEYEIYTFNSQVVTTEIDEERAGDDDLNGLPEPYRFIKTEIKRLVEENTSFPVTVRLEDESNATVYAPENSMSRVIGSGGEAIHAVEDAVDIHIDVQPLTELDTTNQSTVDESLPGDRIDPQLSRRTISLPLSDSDAGSPVEIHVDGEYLLTATAGRDGVINMKRNSEFGSQLQTAITNNKSIHAVGQDK